MRNSPSAHLGVWARCVYPRGVHSVVCNVNICTQMYVHAHAYKVHMYLNYLDFHQYNECGLSI